MNSLWKKAGSVLLGAAAMTAALGMTALAEPAAGSAEETAVETVVDLVSPEFHPLAGRAKDIAAAASWVLSLFVALAGACVYISALVRLISSL